MPEEGDENPLNWKRHPETQTQALESVIFGESGVGWAGAALLNDRQVGDGWTKTQAKPTFIDGHARRELCVKHRAPMPVLIGRWTPDQERIILASLDPIGALAEINRTALKDLLGRLESQSAPIRTFWRSSHHETGSCRRHLPRSSIN